MKQEETQKMARKPEVVWEKLDGKTPVWSADGVWDLFAPYPFGIDPGGRHVLDLGLKTRRVVLPFVAPGARSVGVVLEHGDPINSESTVRVTLINTGNQPFLVEAGERIIRAAELGK